MAHRDARFPTLLDCGESGIDWQLAPEAAASDEKLVLMLNLTLAVISVRVAPCHGAAIRVSC